MERSIVSFFYYLSDIYGWIETVSNVHDDIRPEDLVISGQAVNLDFRDCNAIGKIVKWFSLAGLPVIVQVRSSNHSQEQQTNQSKQARWVEVFNIICFYSYTNVF